VEDLPKTQVKSTQDVASDSVGGRIRRGVPRRRLPRGASVAVVQDSGGEADAILNDPYGPGTRSDALPFDQAVRSGLCYWPRPMRGPTNYEKMAHRNFHAEYVQEQCRHPSRRTCAHGQTQRYVSNRRTLEQADMRGDPACWRDLAVRPSRRIPKRLTETPQRRRSNSWRTRNGRWMSSDCATAGVPVRSRERCQEIQLPPSMERLPPE